MAESDDRMSMESSASVEEFPVRKIQFSPMSIKKQQQAQQKQMMPPPASSQSQSVSASAAPKPKEKDSIHVFLRLKPSGNAEAEECLNVVSDTTVALNPPKNDLFVRSGANETTADKYLFNGVYPSNVSQDDVYATSGAPLVDSLIEGTNGLLFSYGPTNAGKTYTIQGEPGNEGILPRVLGDVLAVVEEENAKFKAGKTNVSFSLWATYMEIYNEKVFDLLGDPATSATGRPHLKIKDENKNIVVKGLKEVKIRTVDDGTSVLTYGQNNRQVAETMVNHDSSRSHSMFNIRLERRRTEDDGTEIAWSSKLSIVDLAGSERSSRTQNTGARLKETSNINVSLMNLGRCLEALRWNQQHPTAHPHMVPFRQSKLTRIFQDWFTNKCRMVMLVNVSAAEEDFDEALQALRYGAIAREINIVNRVNTCNQAVIVTSKAKQVPTQAPSGFNDDVEELMAEVATLQRQLYETESRCAQVETSVREEVIEEMLENMKAMETSFALRMESERISTEEKFQKKLDIIVRESLRRAGLSAQTEHDAEQLAVKAEYYSRRVEELQREHKQALQRLISINNSNTTSSTDEDNKSKKSESESVAPLDGDEEGENAVDGGSNSDYALRCEYLDAEVAQLTKNLELANAQMANKTQAVATARADVEALRGSMQQSEADRRILEEQNDRLREEIGHMKVTVAEQQTVEVSKQPSADTSCSIEEKQALIARAEAAECERDATVLAAREAASKMAADAKELVSTATSTLKATLDEEYLTKRQAMEEELAAAQAHVAAMQEEVSSLNDKVDSMDSIAVAHKAFAEVVASSVAQCRDCAPRVQHAMEGKAGETSLCSLGSPYAPIVSMSLFANQSSCNTSEQPPVMSMSMLGKRSSNEMHSIEMSDVVLEDGYAAVGGVEAYAGVDVADEEAGDVDGSFCKKSKKSVKGKGKGKGILKRLIGMSSSSTDKDTSTKTKGKGKGKGKGKSKSKGEKVQEATAVDDENVAPLGDSANLVAPPSTDGKRRSKRSMVNAVTAAASKITVDSVEPSPALPVRRTRRTASMEMMEGGTR